MELTNFWYMIVWLLAASFFAAVFLEKDKVNFYGITENRWSVGTAVLLFLPFIIWAGFRTTAYGDTAAYIRMFNDAPSDLSQLSSYTMSQTKDKGYTVFTILFKAILGESSTLFFLLIAAIQGIVLINIYRKYSCDYAFSIFLFVASTDYISWMHNGMRQFFAVTIAFACFPLIIKKKYLSAIAIILLAATIHASILIVLPFIVIAQGEPWNKKTLLFLIGVMLAIVYLDRFTSAVTTIMENSQYSAEVEDFINDDGVNLFRVLVYSIPAVMALAFRRKISYYDNPVINFSINMSIVASGLYIIGYFTSGIMFGRLPIAFVLYSYISLPWMIERIFTEKSAQMIKLICMGCYLAFFYYQMHISWGLL